MIRPRPATAALALLALVGCPIPQPLPSYPPGQPITPPRIIVDDTVHAVSPADTIVRVAAGCATPPVFSLEAMLRHELTDEPVSARWFIDYDPTNQQRSAPFRADEIPPPGTSAADPTLRTVPALSFRPYDFDPPVRGTGATSSAPGAVHVVELVVSNRFDPKYDVFPAPEGGVPYRKPSLNFEIQLYRWVFVTTAEDPASCTGAACVRCTVAATP